MKICPLCGSNALRDMNGVFEMPVPKNIPGGSILINDATWESCTDCGESFIPHLLSEAIDKVRSQRMGVRCDKEKRQS